MLALLQVSLVLCSSVLSVAYEVRVFLFFFFSSRRRHTRYIGDWSSDVCSSDLNAWLALMLQLGPVGLLLIVGALVAGIRNAWYNARRSPRRADLLVIALLTYLTTVAFTSDVFYEIGRASCRERV